MSQRVTRGYEFVKTVEVIRLESGDILTVHGLDQCSGHYCTIHNPSEHRLVNAPLYWRVDRYIMERICPHGIGHPDPDDRKVKESPSAGVHGCDGCC